MQQAAEADKSAHTNAVEAEVVCRLTEIVARLAKQGGRPPPSPAAHPPRILGLERKGAGRVMARTNAKATLSKADLAHSAAGSGLWIEALPN